MSNFTPRNLTPTQQRALEDEFARGFSDPTFRETTWYELNEFFRKAGPQTIQQYYYSFFRYFVRLNWKMFQKLNPDEIIRAFRYQIPIAVAFDVDPIHEFLYWLNTRPYTRDEAVQIFEKAKQAFMTSDGYFGTSQGKDHTIKDVLSEMGVGPAPDRSSVDQAKVYGDLVAMVKVPTELTDVLVKFPRVEESDIVDKFAEVANVFEDTPQDEVRDLLAHYEHDSWFYEPISDEFIEQVRREQAGEANPLAQAVANEGLKEKAVASQAPKTVVTVPSTIDVPAAPNEVFLDEIPAHVDTFPQWMGSDETRQSLVAWMKSVRDPVIARVQLGAALREHVPVDATHMEHAGAIVELDAYLRDQGFSSGKDFLYFDAEKGGFEWNEV